MEPTLKQLIEMELDRLSGNQEKRIKNFRKQSKASLPLEEKLLIQKKIQAAEKVLHSLRVNRFTLEDSAK